jgi:hypothetical protein
MVPRLNTVDRLAALEQRAAAHEQRADAHEKLVKPMVDQVTELYNAWTTGRKMLVRFNRIWVKLGAIAAGLLGAAAAILTIIEKVRVLLGH